MAMTEEQKQRARENLAKARAAKAAKASEAEKNAAAPAAPVEVVADAEQSLQASEKKMYDQLKNDELVTFVIPYERGAETQHYMRSFNGVIVNIKRGEPAQLPKSIVEHIKRSEQIAIMSAAATAPFASARGKQL